MRHPAASASGQDRLLLYRYAPYLYCLPFHTQSPAPKIIAKKIKLQGLNALHSVTALHLYFLAAKLTLVYLCAVRRLRGAGAGALLSLRVILVLPCGIVKLAACLRRFFFRRAYGIDEYLHVSDGL